MFNELGLNAKKIQKELNKKDKQKLSNDKMTIVIDKIKEQGRDKRLFFDSYITSPRHT